METINLNVSFTLKQLIEVVKKLSPKDKTILNDAIWEDNFIIPEEHKEIVMARIKEAEENPELMLDWDVASKTLRP